jgi:maltoporin
MDIKVGRHFCRFGYESLNPIQTVLPSWSYAFTYNPFTHTGLFTETKLDDTWTVTNDFVLGNDNFIDNSNRFYYLGAIGWAAPESKTTAKVAAILGYGRFDRSNNFNNPQLIDAVITHKLTDDLTYAFEFLYGWQHEVPDVGFAQWYHFVNYLTYKIDDKWSTTARVEFFDDVDGNRTGFAGFYNSYTLGVTWKPCDSIMIRPEVRYDRCMNNTPFDGRKDFFGGMINAIFVW